MKIFKDDWEMGSGIVLHMLSLLSRHGAGKARKLFVYLIEVLRSGLESIKVQIFDGNDMHGDASLR